MLVIELVRQPDWLANKSLQNVHILLFLAVVGRVKSLVAMLGLRKPKFLNNSIL
jgi:hypothetical protein